MNKMSIFTEGKIPWCQRPWSSFLTIDHVANSRVSWSVPKAPPQPPSLTTKLGLIKFQEHAWQISIKKDKTKDNKQLLTYCYKPALTLLTETCDNKKNATQPWHTAKVNTYNVTALCT